MCKTPSEWKQGFHTLAPPLPAKVCNSSRRGSYKEPVSCPGPAETPRKGNPKTAWVAELEVPPPHMRTAIYEWPRGTTRAYCACAFRLGTGRERGGFPLSHEEKNGSAAVARPPFLRFLPQSASWLPHTAATAPAAAATCAQHCKGYLTRSRPPRETNRGSASAPLLPAARAPPANQRTGRPLRPLPAGQV